MREGAVGSFGPRQQVLGRVPVKLALPVAAHAAKVGSNVTQLPVRRIGAP